MIAYRYTSPVGVFTILPRHNRWALCFADEVLGMYDTPVAAADDVYTQTSGCYEWDSLGMDAIMDAPTDLYEWDKVG